jgi:hypothetical protein
LAPVAPCRAVFRSPDELCGNGVTRRQAEQICFAARDCEFSRFHFPLSSSAVSILISGINSGAHDLKQETISGK